VHSSEHVKRNPTVVAADPASASEDGGSDVDGDGKNGVGDGGGQEEAAQVVGSVDLLSFPGRPDGLGFLEESGEGDS